MTLDPILDLTVRELLYRVQSALYIEADHQEGKDGVVSWRRGPFFLCADSSDYLEIPMRSTVTRPSSRVAVRFEVLFHSLPKAAVSLFQVTKKSSRHVAVLGSVTIDPVGMKIRLKSRQTATRSVTKSCNFRLEPEVSYSVRYLLNLATKICQITVSLAGSDEEAAETLITRKLYLADTIPARSVRVVLGKLPSKSQTGCPAGAEFSNLEFLCGS